MKRLTSIVLFFVALGAARALHAQPQATPREAATSLGAKMTLISAGKFVMGSLPGEWGRGADEEPRHEVRITRPFYMGCGEVTNREFQQFVDASKYNPIPLAESDSQFLYYLAGAGKKKYDGTPVNAPDNPVVWVSWYSACRFCNWLSEKEGLPPVYLFTESANKGLPPEVSMSRPHDGGYRLPTEAEWEYAARAGTTGAYSFGPDDKNYLQYAYNSSLDRAFSINTAPVLSGKPNPWGLHQMNGNVGEWCWDIFAHAYDMNQPVDPLGALAGRSRVDRGGSFRLAPAYGRSAARLMDVPTMTRYDLGFRVMRNVTP